MLLCRVQPLQLPDPAPASWGHPCKGLLPVWLRDALHTARSASSRSTVRLPGIPRVPLCLGNCCLAGETLSLWLSPRRMGATVPDLWVAAQCPTTGSQPPPGFSPVCVPDWLCPVLLLYVEVGDHHGSCEMSVSCAPVANVEGGLTLPSLCQPVSASCFTNHPLLAPPACATLSGFPALCSPRHQPVLPSAYVDGEEVPLHQPVQAASHYAALPLSGRTVVCVTEGETARRRPCSSQRPGQ